MADTGRSAALLRLIADSVGVDVGTLIALSGVEAASDLPRDRAGGDFASPQMLRLVRLFHALPSAELRCQALQILETLASHANAKAADRGRDAPDR